MSESPALTGDPQFIERGWWLFDLGTAEWLLGVIKDQDLVACALAALAVGCDSSGLASIAVLREHDRGAILAGIYAAGEERGVEFPLSEEAVKRSYEGVLILMVEGSITPEEASIKLWTLADKDPRDGFDERLSEFKGLAIELDLHEAPECDFDLDLDEWRGRMLDLARDTLVHGVGRNPDEWAEDE
jgi:hypothetical protein